MSKQIIKELNLHQLFYFLTRESSVDGKPYYETVFTTKQIESIGRYIKRMLYGVDMDSEFSQHTIEQFKEKQNLEKHLKTEQKKAIRDTARQSRDEHIPIVVYVTKNGEPYSQHTCQVVSANLCKLKINNLMPKVYSGFTESMPIDSSGTGDDDPCYELNMQTRVIRYMMSTNTDGDVYELTLKLNGTTPEPPSHHM